MGHWHQRQEGSSRESQAELERRELAQHAAGQRHAEAGSEPQTPMEWWRQFEADLAAVDWALEREQRAALAAGRPWPPGRQPQTEAEPVPKPDSNPGAEQEADGRFGPDDQAARLDRLLAQTTEAAWGLAAENAASEARAGYAARLEREAHAGSEHIVHAQASYEAEIEP